MFTFDELWGSLGTSIFEISSSAANNTGYLPGYLSGSYEYDSMSLFSSTNWKSSKRFAKILLTEKFIHLKHSFFNKINTELSKAIMRRTRSRNKFLRNRSTENRDNKQRNYFVYLVRKLKRKYIQYSIFSNTCVRVSKCVRVINTCVQFYKYLCQSLFFNKVAGLRPVTLLKKRLWYKSFPVNFAKFLRTLFSQTPTVNTLRIACFYRIL